MLPPLSKNAFELTLEQQLELRIMSDAVTRMDRETLEKMIIDAMRLNMINSNFIKNIGKSN